MVEVKNLAVGKLYIEEGGHQQSSSLYKYEGVDEDAYNRRNYPQNPEYWDDQHIFRCVEFDCDDETLEFDANTLEIPMDATSP